MAEYTVVPTNMIHALPENVSMELGALVEPMSVLVPAFIADDTDGRGADAIYEKPLMTPLQKIVMNESRIQGSLCYTSADYDAVIDLMSQGKHDTTGIGRGIATASPSTRIARELSAPTCGSPSTSGSPN